MKEGFHATEASRDFPTISQQLINPGCVRRWSAAHPQTMGYIDFWKWATGTDDLLMPRRPLRSMAQAKRREILDEILKRMNERDPQLVAKATAEGWRVLKALINQYVDGRYTQGRSPSLSKMMSVYAPSSDNNNPFAYAHMIGARIGLSHDEILKVPLADLITAD